MAHPHVIVAGLGWDDDDIEALCEVLPLCSRAHSLNVSRNPKVGDRGIAALAAALSQNAAPRLREVNVRLTSFGAGGMNALRKVSRDRDVIWYV